MNEAVDDFEPERLMGLLRTDVANPGIRGHFGAACITSPSLRLAHKLCADPSAAEFSLTYQPSMKPTSCVGSQPSAWDRREVCRILAYKFHRKRARLALLRDLRSGIPRYPAIVASSDALQHMCAWFRREKSVITPMLGECAGKARVVGMRYQPPSSFRLQPQHCLLLNFCDREVTQLPAPARIRASCTGSTLHQIEKRKAHPCAVATRAQRCVITAKIAISPAVRDSQKKVGGCRQCGKAC